jgi:hypothetical protein
MAAGFIAVENGLQLDQKLKHIIQEYKECAVFLELIAAGQFNPIQEELEYFQIRARHVEYELLMIPSKHKEFAREHPTQEVVRIALFACVVVNFAYYQPFSAISRALAGQLKIALERTDLTSACYPHQKLLIWVSWVGIETSRGQMEYPWFLLCLARAACGLRVEDLVS